MMKSSQPLPDDGLRNQRGYIIYMVSQELYRDYRYERPNDTPEQLSEYCQKIAAEEVDKLLTDTVEHVINKPQTIFLSKNDDGSIDMQDDVVAHWNRLRQLQMETYQELLKEKS